MSKKLKKTSTSSKKQKAATGKIQPMNTPARHDQDPEGPTVLTGRIWQDPQKKTWHAEVPYLGVTMNAGNKDTLLDAVQSGVELLSADPDFEVEVTLIQEYLFIQSNNPEELLSLNDAIPFFLNPDAMFFHMHRKSPHIAKNP